ncbi:LVIVD repeat-containing protein [Halobaculum sp. P14]|uniref:LVIVD repeat-containing protein n=1 Tax=Halobaculum sp. P14 TaxID=3421638 RepID=UPI003EBBD573
MQRREALRAGASAVAAGVVGTGVLTGRGSARSDADTDSFAPLGRLPLRGAKEAVVSADGDTAYVALTDGYATVDVSDPAAPTVLAERRGLLAERDDGPLRQVYDVKADGDTLVAVGPAHAGAPGPRGAVVVDVSDPANPERRGVYDTDFPIHNCDLVDGHLYLTGNGLPGNPLVVVDVASLSAVGRWALTDHDEDWADVRSALRVVHDVVVRDGVAALAYWDAGTYLLDVSAPSAPSLLGRVPAQSPAELRDPPANEVFAPPGNHHYAEVDPADDLLGVGVESWAVRRDGSLVGGPGGIDLYDVSDPAAPRHLSHVAPPASRDATYGGVWTTAHNFELRGGTLYSSWYHGGVKRHDVSDPAAPTQESWWVDPDAARFWTARAAVDGDCFVASSMGTDGASAGLWTFPDTAGTGGTPDALTAPPTPEPGTEPSPPPAATGTPAGTSPAGEPRTEPPGTSGSTAATSPGFGALGALGSVAGLGAWAWLRRRRR